MALLAPNRKHDRRANTAGLSTEIFYISDKFFGGAEGNRTLDLLNAIQALSQLSYGPT